MPTSALKLYHFVVEYLVLLDSRHGETHANLFAELFLLNKAVLAA